MIIFALLMVTGRQVWAGSLESREVISQGGSGYVFISCSLRAKHHLFFMTFSCFSRTAGGITLGFDAICSETVPGYADRLVAAIYRDSIINAKFLADLVTVALVVFSLGITWAV
jgi:ABC-2 type transport system permease protein